MLNGPKALRVFALLLGHVLPLILLARAWQHGSWLQLVTGASTGYLTLELIVVFTHWALDNWFSAKTPVIGSVVFYFREHHVLPMQMFQRDFFDNNFENALIGLLFSVPTFFSHAGPFGCALVGFGSLWSGWVTTIHKAAHVESPHPVARVLQRLHLIVDRAHHDVHHAGAGRNYGLVCGWLDRAVDALHLFELLELILVRLTGQVPVHPRLDSTRARAKRLAIGEQGS